MGRTGIGTVLIVAAVCSFSTGCLWHERRHDVYVEPPRVVEHREHREEFHEEHHDEHWH